jgi:hypothetical protein
VILLLHLISASGGVFLMPANQLLWLKILVDMGGVLALAVITSR